MNVLARSSDSATGPGAASRLLGLFIAAAILLVAILVRVTALENHDVAWYTLAAARMLGGGSYARDFFEVNMPLAIALYIPPVALAASMHLHTAVAVDLLVLVLIIQAAALCALLSNPGDGPFVASPFAHGWLAAWVLLVLCFEPGYDFAQREHFIAILTLPFLFLVANGGAAFSRPLRSYVALLAGIGFMIKPHYWPLPWLLLGLRAWRGRNWRLLGSLEARVLLGVFAATLAGTLWRYPDWIECLRWASDLYPSFSHDVLRRMLNLRGIAVLAACLVFQWLFVLRDRRFAAPVMPFLASATYSLGAAIVQGKGWQYHFLPAAVFAYCGLAPVLAGTIRELGSRPRAAPVLKALVAAGLMTGAATTAVAAARNTPTFGSLGLIPQALRSVAANGDPVYAFSVEVQPMLPAVPLLGLHWASRYSSLWPLPALLRAEREQGSPDAARLLATYRPPFTQSVIDDFGRHRPRIVLVDRHRLPGQPADYDLMTFFLADPAFAAIWANYVRIGSVTYPDSVTGYDIYVRAEAGPDTPPQSSGS